MINEKWTTKAGEKVEVKDMTNNHLVNTIAYLKRNMPDHEHNEHIVADHWSMNGVVVVLGSEHYTEWINVFEKELKKRL